MTYVELLVPADGAADAIDLRNVLGSRGIDCHMGVDQLTQGTPVATVAIMRHPSEHLWYSIGYRAGQAVPLFLLRDEEDRPDTFPAATANFLLSDDKMGERLANSLQRLLGLSISESERPGDPEDLARWISKDWERLRDLDSSSLADLVGLSLRRSGFSTERIFREGAVDIWASLPGLDFSLAFECKASRADRPIGLGDVRDAYTLCSARRSNFIVVVSNSSFTKAAHSWASCAVPAIHLLDQSSLRAKLKDVFGSGSKGGKERGLNTLLEWADPSSRLGRSILRGRVGGLLGSADESPVEEGFRLEATGNASLFDLDVCVVVGDEVARSEERIEELLLKLRHESWRFKVLSEDEANVESWRKALKGSRYVVFIPSEAGGRPLWRDRHLQLIAHWCGAGLQRAEQYFIVAQDNPINRLSMPTCMRDPVFLDPSIGDYFKAMRKRARQMPIDPTGEGGTGEGRR